MMMSLSYSQKRMPEGGGVPRVAFFEMFYYFEVAQLKINLFYSKQKKKKNRQKVHFSFALKRSDPQGGAVCPCLYTWGLGVPGKERQSDTLQKKKKKKDGINLV